MCDPTAILVGKGAAAGMGALGSFVSASGEKAGYKTQARIAELNAQAADEDARRARMQGERSEQRLRLAAAQLSSRQRAAMGANNVDMSEGSALNTLLSTDYMAESDAITLRVNTELAASDAKRRATGQRMDAAIARGQAAGTSPFLSGVTSLAAGAEKVADEWGRMKRAGVFAPRALDYDLQFSGWE